MAYSIRTLPKPSAKYIKSTGEYYEIEGKKDTIKTPYGSVEVWGRATMGGELRVIFPENALKDTDESRLSFAYLATGPLKNDYFIFVNDVGNVVTNDFAPFVSPGMRRNFHLNLFMSYHDHKLWEHFGSYKALREIGIEEIMSKALGKRYGLGTSGLYDVDKLIGQISRPKTPFTIEAVIYILSICIAVSVYDAQDTELLKAGKPYLRIKTDSGTLVFHSGDMIFAALSDPYWLDPLSRSVQTIAEIVAKPETYPAVPYSHWLEWEDSSDNLSSFFPSGEELEKYKAIANAPIPMQENVSSGIKSVFCHAQELARNMREKHLKEDNTTEEFIFVWRCRRCGQFHTVSQIPDLSKPFEIKKRWMQLQDVASSGGVGVICDKGHFLHQKDLCYLMHARHLIWPGVDLIMSMGRIDSVRIMNGWGYRDLKTGEYIGFFDNPSPGTLNDELQRYDSPIVRLREILLRENAETMRLDSNEVRMIAIGESMQFAYSAMKIILKDERWYDNRHWRAYDAVDLGLSEHGVHGYIMVDFPKFKELLADSISNSGLSSEYKIIEKDDETFIIYSDNTWFKLDLERELTTRIQQGFYPEEIAQLMVEKARRRCAEFSKALAELHNMYPEVVHEIDFEKGVIKLNNKGKEVSCLVLSAIFATEGPLKHLDFLLSEETDDIYRCRCGKPAIISVKYRRLGSSRFKGEPRNWAVRQQGAALENKEGTFSTDVYEPVLASSLGESDSSEEGGIRLASLMGDDLVQMYVKQCNDHIVEIDEEIVKKTGIDIKSLEYLYLCSVERTFSRFRVIKSSQEDLADYSAVVGKDAASLAVDARLAAGFCEAAGIKVGREFGVRAEYDDLLIICNDPYNDAKAAAFFARVSKRLGGKKNFGDQIGYFDTFKSRTCRGHFEVADLLYV
ncbi:MAG: hypothetical protein K6G50_01365 [bacterium]|nr:hypothetical protein [bacterium]